MLTSGNRNENAWCGSVSRRALRRFLVRFPVAVASLCAPLTAQEVEPLSPTELVFGEEINVRVVNLEVVVEDRSGNRVRGLSRDDFRILVDDEEVDVQYFSEVADRQVVMGAGGETPPALAGGPDVVTNYVLFVDDDHTHVTLRRPVLNGFRAQLDILGAQDQVAVVVMSDSRLEVVSRFTTDREATRAALAELEVGGRYGGFMSTWAFRKRLRALASSTGGSSVPQSEGASLAEVPAPLNPAPLKTSTAFEWTFTGRGDLLYRAEDLRFSIDSVISTMRALEVPHGRKVFLLLAGNWPTLSLPPGRAGLTGFLWTAPGSRVWTDLELLEELVDTANLLGYTVYPMDQQGNPRTMLWSNFRYVARGTGGKAFMAGSNMKALDKVSFDTSNYYWLGFVPDYQRDNQAHDIRVQLREPGLRARYRRGYSDLSGRVEADMEALQELLVPPEVEADDGPLRVEVGDAVATRRRTMQVPVTIHLRVGKFPAVPRDGAFLQELELRFVALDRFRRRFEIPAVSLSLGGGYEPAPDEVVVYRASLTLRRRPQELVVTVHDPISKLTARGRVAVTGVRR